MTSAATFEHAVIARLVADATLSGLVGDRVIAGGLETDVVRPYVSVRRLTTLPGNTVGASRDSARALLDISSHGDSLDEAIEVAQAVRASLAGFRGTVSGVKIKATYWIDEQDFEPRIGSKTYRRQQTYSLWGDE